MKKIRTAIVGTGFMGRVHLEALRRTESIEIAAVVGREAESAQKIARGFDVPSTTDLARVLGDSTIDAVHICTPNASHYTSSLSALKEGKHVLCEKPLSVSAAEAEELVSVAKDRGLRNCVCHNLRYYPLVQQMRTMRESGELGEILVAQGTYSQDWLLYETDWNWRVDPTTGGPLRAMADVGTHWFDMVSHVTGLRVTSLSADIQTFHKERRRPRQKTETFGGKPLQSEDVEVIQVKSDDFASVSFHLGKKARGMMTASQVSAGRKNRLSIEIYGSESSVAWDQERPDELWIGHRNAPNQTIVKDPSLLRGTARTFADLPGGHSEGYGDTFKQIFRRFYASILDPDLTPEYPQMEDGLHQMKLLDAVLASNERRSWVELSTE
jgi:predicted dehydrogenase